ncbi:tetratricopeptide repeat protein [candidate division KSB1 bacterium]|nr:tetratricopeptide repeat protein [candidate division KSB1 bacterium]
MKFRHVVFIIILFLWKSNASSQQDYIHFVPGAQSAALGNASIDGLLSPAAIYWNPGALAFASSRQLFLGINAPFSINYFGVSDFYPAIGALGLAFSAIPVHRRTLQTTTFAWANDFTSNTGLGMNLNFHEVNQEYYTSVGLGSYFQIPARKTILYHSQFLAKFIDDGLIGFGLNALNLPIFDHQTDYSVRIGFRYEIPGKGPKLQYVAHFQKKEISHHLGFGYQFLPSFTLFAGTQDFNLQKSAIGIRLQDKNYAFDFCWANENKSVQASIQMILGKSAPERAREHLARANEFLREKNYRQSIFEFENSLRFAKNDSINRLVKYLYTKKQEEDRFIDSLNLEGLKHQSQKNYLTSELFYKRVLKIDPNSRIALENRKLIAPYVQALSQRLLKNANDHFARGDLLNTRKYLRAFLHFQENNYEAEQFLKLVTDSLQQSAQIHFYRGWGYEEQKNYLRAKEEYELALECDPESEQISRRYQNLSNRVQREAEIRNKQIATFLQLARQMKERKNQVGAYMNYQKVLNFDPSNLEALEGIKQTRFEVQAYLARNFKTAQRLFERNDLSAAENLFKEIKNLSVLESSFNNYERESNSYLQRINSVRTAECDQLYVEGLKKIQEQNWKEAREYFKRMVGLNCKQQIALEKMQEVSSRLRADSLSEVGQAFFQRGELLNAMRVYQQAIQILPESQLILFQMEKCQAEINKKIDEHFNRGMSFYNEQNYNQAIIEWEQVLTFNPDHYDSIDYIQRAKKRLDALNQFK